MHEIRLAATAFVLVAVSAIGFAAVRFDSPTLPDLAPPSRRAPIAERVALVVLDGVREDRFRALLHRTAKRAEERGTVCPVLGPEISFTVAGVYALGTGDLPKVALIPDNFHPRAVQVDSLPAALARRGGRTLLFGDPIWQHLFGQHATAMATAPDLGPYAEHAPVAGAFQQSLQGARCDLCIWHDGGFDAAAHAYGLYGARYVDYADAIDRELAALAEALPEVTWLVTSDHGALDSGNHGGAQPEARASFLAAWGPGIRRTACPGRLDQADIPTMTAVLLGAAIPWHSRGTVPDLLDGVGATELLAQKQRLATALAAAYGGHSPKPDATVAECVAIIDAVQRRSRRAVMLAWVSPLLLAAALLGKRLGGLASWLRASIIVPCLAVLAFALVFANAIYSRVSYATAATIFAAATVTPVVASLRPNLRSTRAPLAMALCVLVAAQTNWAAHVMAASLGIAVWICLGDRKRCWRWLGVTAALVAVGLVELAWLRLVALRSLPAGPIPTLGGALAAAALGRWLGPPRAGPLVAGCGYLLVAAAPSHLQPFAPLLAAAAAATARKPAHDVVLAALLALYAAQATPLHWAVVVVVTMVGVELIGSRALDRRLEPTAAALVRGATLLGFGYTLTVLEGMVLDLSAVNVLAGFFRGGLLLHLPITATLVALYYSAPVLLLGLCWTKKALSPAHVERAAIAAALLAAAKLTLHLLAFTWGDMALGSWSRLLAESLLLLLFFAAALVVAALVALTRRCVAGNHART